jgi:hypothetical protein
MTKPIELRVTTMGFRSFLAHIRQQTLCLEAVFKAHLRPEQLHGSLASD